MINAFDYVKDHKDDPTFTSPNYSLMFERALVCGGADPQYHIKRQCRFEEVEEVKTIFKNPFISWWELDKNAWLDGPTMFSPRYRAATINKKDKLWILGGRDGSQILRDNEVLFYPGSFEGQNVNIKRWEWANKKMKNILIWKNVVPDAMKNLPIPLTGHCAVNIDDRFSLVIGGATTKSNSDGSFVAFSGPELTNHVHLYDFLRHEWVSTYTNSKLDGKELKRMKIPRMNHACVMFEDKGNKKVMVAGGVSMDLNEEHAMENTAEIFDIDNLDWVFATDLPKIITGSKLIVTAERPTLVGRYGNERQHVMLRYSQLEEWESLPIRLLDGRSDFQILEKIPRVVSVFPYMSSSLTKSNPGSCATNNWRNVLGLIENGKRAIIRTNSQIQPWIQLDLGQELLVVTVSINIEWRAQCAMHNSYFKVYFVSGIQEIGSFQNCEVNKYIEIYKYYSI